MAACASAYRRILRYGPALPHRPAPAAHSACSAADCSWSTRPRLLGRGPQRPRGRRRGGRHAGSCGPDGLGVLRGQSRRRACSRSFMRRFLVGGVPARPRGTCRWICSPTSSGCRPAFFDRTRTGDLIARLTSDVEAVRFSSRPGPDVRGRARSYSFRPWRSRACSDLSWHADGHGGPPARCSTIIGPRARPRARASCAARVPCRIASGRPELLAPRRASQARG